VSTGVRAGRIPVVVVGGFLGSGKTTLLRASLAGEPGTAVIVNEFGAISLDHRLLRTSEERVEVIGGGCACCAKREDLVRVLRDLLDDRDRGRADLRRVVIETSGLADPAPIVFTITTDPMLRHHFEVERLTVTVDAVNGPGQLAAHAEAVKQALVADELVVTKADLVESEHVDELVARLAALNPAAAIRAASDGVLLPGALRGPGAARPRDGGPGELGAAHTDDVRTLRVDGAGPVDWTGFAIWLSMLLHARGEQVLRVKGLLELDDGELVSINGVQHVVHPPEHLPAERIPDEPPGIVFITRGLETDLLGDSLATFQRVARRAGGAPAA
jgi:G3E family GTPase